MKQATNSRVAGLLALLALAAGSAAAEEPALDPEMMAKVYKAAVPGEEHKRLHALAGSWTVVARITPAPGADPITITGEVEARNILGGRFLFVQTKAGEAPPVQVESLQIFGFDGRKGVYTVVGFDTMGTYSVSAEGRWDEKRGAMVLSGTDDDPLLGHTQEYDMVLRPVDDDHFVFEVIFKDEAHTKGKGPHKMIEMTHTRVK